MVFQASIAALGNKLFTLLREPRNKALPTFLAGQNFYFHTHVKDRDFRIHDPGDAHGILFCGDHGIEIPPSAAADEAINFFHRVAVVVRVGLRQVEFRTEATKGRFKTLGHCDATEGSDFQAAQKLQRLHLAGGKIFQMLWVVSALDDFGGAVVKADS